MQEKTEQTKEQADLARKEIIRRNLEELRRRKENGELDKRDFRELEISQTDLELRPLVRNDLRIERDGVVFEQAIVVSQEDLEDFRFISFIFPDGTVVDINEDPTSGDPADRTGYTPGDILVVFPEELGEVRPEIYQTIKFAQKIIEGKYGSSPPEDSLDPQKVFSGPILDLNDKSLTPVEVSFLEDWIEEHLLSRPKEAPVKKKLRSPDGLTEVVIYDVPLGKDKELYLSRWQNQGEEPSFVLWPVDFYDLQADSYSE